MAGMGAKRAIVGSNNFEIVRFMEIKAPDMMPSSVPREKPRNNLVVLIRACFSSVPSFKSVKRSFNVAQGDATIVFGTMANRTSRSQATSMAMGTISAVQLFFNFIY